MRSPWWERGVVDDQPCIMRRRDPDRDDVVQHARGERDADDPVVRAAPAGAAATALPFASDVSWSPRVTAPPQITSAIAVHDHVAALVDGGGDVLATRRSACRPRPRPGRPCRRRSRMLDDEVRADGRLGVEVAFEQDVHEGFASLGVWGFGQAAALTRATASPRNRPARLRLLVHELPAALAIAMASLPVVDARGLRPRSACRRARRSARRCRGRP
jgi:hypothetical protein